MIGRAARVGQRSKIIVEGMAFLSNDDDVLEMLKIAIGVGGMRGIHHRHGTGNNGREIAREFFHFSASALTPFKARSMVA